MTEAECYRITDCRAGLGDRACRRCEKCGSTDSLTHHHRIKRSHGVRHDPSNVVVLCLVCHPWVEANPAAANVLGWALHPSEDPLTVPVFQYPIKMLVLLDDNGDMTPVWT